MWFWLILNYSDLYIFPVLAEINPGRLIFLVILALDGIIVASSTWQQIQYCAFAGFTRRFVFTTAHNCRGSKRAKSEKNNHLVLLCCRMFLFLINLTCFSRWWVSHPGATHPSCPTLGATAKVCFYRYIHIGLMFLVLHYSGPEVQNTTTFKKIKHFRKHDDISEKKAISENATKFKKTRQHFRKQNFLKKHDNISENNKIF